MLLQETEQYVSVAGRKGLWARKRVWKLGEKGGVGEFWDSSNRNMVSEKGHFVEEFSSREKKKIYMYII